MTHDSTSHHIFRISELTRLIASQLILINPRDAVNLACACRYLEEPALCTLWEIQWSLCTLLRVLPEENWEIEYPKGGLALKIVGDPPPEAWKRVRRYASWMRRVHVNDGSNVAEDTFHKLRDNSPAGGWFPASQCLSWRITESNLAHTDLFFSPHLKKISVYAPQRWIGSEVPSNILATITSTISALPTSALQFLSVSIYCAVPLTHFTDSLSSVILRCGPSLMEFTSTVPLSDAAVDHLIQLPHLRTWRIEGPPPSYSASPLPPVFPPLTKLALGKDAVRGWLSLFQRSEDDVPTMQGVTPLSKTKESLESLDISSPSGLIINASFISSVQVFRNLVTLGVADPCRDENGEVRCTFKLNNGDITELGMALPRLEFLFLGRPCAENTCVTTVACLLPLSVYCIKLKKLQIHFNTTKIVGDLKNISEDPRLQELCSLPKCPLLHLYVNRMPLTLDEPGFDTAVKGILDIFPSLVDCVGGDRVWDVLSGKIWMINWKTSVKREG